MQLVRGAKNLPEACHPCVATIGNFDGVHLGHQKIIDQLRELAQKKDLLSCLIFFEPQPVEFFRANAAPSRLTSFTEKLNQFEQHRLDQVLMLSFDQELSEMSAQEFIHTILLPLKIQYLIVGEDFRFGRGREAGLDELASIGRQSGFKLLPAETVMSDARRVSSTWIRELLNQGDFESAKRLLGRDYSMRGRVVHGDKRGRDLGFPTANMFLKRRVSPLHGVFATETAVSNGGWLPSVSNVGTRPMFDGQQVLLETHLIDFEGEIYGKNITVRFLQKLRNEEKFSSIAELKNQIGNDLQNAREFHRNHQYTIKNNE